MSGVVYSTRFGAATINSTVTTLYTVPVGYVAVLRTVTIGWGLTAGAGGNFALQLGASNSRVYAKTLAESTVGSDVWNGDLVLPAGEILRASITGTGSIYVTVSGYLLSLP